MQGVAIGKIVKRMGLKNWTNDMDLKGHRILLSDVNRPALQLSGYFNHFEEKRVQIIGNVEYEYNPYKNIIFMLEMSYSLLFYLFFHF